jgi:transposase, IS5 family
MLSKPKPTNQLGFYSRLEDQLDRNHSLYILAQKIDWLFFDNAFSKHYSSSQGKPSKPIRLMVSLLIIKQLRNLSDESIVEQWSENAYYQYVGGEVSFITKRPCVATELVEFRKRIGQEGMELIFKESIRINGKDGEDKYLTADTTIQEKNITYPTDDKLYKKIIKKCQGIAGKEAIELRQSYKQTIKKLSITQRLKRTKGGDVKARKASKKIKTIAGRLVRELERKLPSTSLNIKYGLDLELYKRVLLQKRSDSDKIYSLHEPQVKCYTKGKEHKKYEFGSKVSLLITQKTGVIVGALNFTDTLHDSKTVPMAIEQYERLTGRKASDVFLDRGYRGARLESTRVNVPKPEKNISQAKRKRFRRRAAIEPVIGHLKHDYRMIRNYLKGSSGDAMNLLLSAAAMNFKRAMNLWKQGIRVPLLFLTTIINQFKILFGFRRFLKPTF